MKRLLKELNSKMDTTSGYIALALILCLALVPLTMSLNDMREEDLTTPTVSFPAREYVKDPCKRTIMTEDQIKQCGFKLTQISMWNIGDPRQNWGDPCITKSGHDGCELLKQGLNICAYNKELIGSDLSIYYRKSNGNYFKLGVCRVLDNTHKNYARRIDWALPEQMKQHAWDWGVVTGYYKVVVPDYNETIDIYQ